MNHESISLTDRPAYPAYYLGRPRGWYTSRYAPTDHPSNETFG